MMNLEPKRVLIAEDHYVSRHLLERNLANWGFQVLAAEDGEAALKILEGEDPPAIVILDWMMPKMDGLEVCRRVRAHLGRPFTYLMLLTERNNKDEIAAVFASGVDEYVIKPFDPDELRARLKVARRVVALERKLTLREKELQEAREQLAGLRAASAQGPRAGDEAPRDVAANVSRL
ncbi:MAG: phosphoserine phosphatase RsbU/P [Chthoniobacter sp.]|jgi:DNA-binding response OmpR family regulator|nr:phosphoserine phosphatase RsbU/P [Chthoniobacter sp.]